MPKKQNGVPAKTRPTFMLAALRHMSNSMLLGRAKLAAALGQTFGGDRDMYTVLGYKKVLDYDYFDALYTRQDIAGRIVDLPAQSTWKKGPEVRDTDNPDVETEFEMAWESLVRKLRVWHYFRRADQVAGIGQYGVLFLGLPGPLESPAARVNGPEGLMYLSVYSQRAASVSKFVSDTADPRFGLPEMYTVDFSNPEKNQLLSGSGKGVLLRGTGMREQKVHWTRVIHIADGLVEDEVYGMPRLQRVANLMEDLAKTVGGSAEMFWQAASKGMQMDIDPEAELTSDDEDNLETEVDEYIHGLRRWIRTRGATIKELGGKNVDPRGVFTAIVSLVSGATGIPQRILIGSERGQLASIQDKRNWNERVAERQVTFGEPMVLRPFVDRCIVQGVLPEPKGGQYVVKWSDMTALGEDQISLIAQRSSNAIKQFEEAKAVAAKAGTHFPVTDEEFREKMLGLAPLGPGKTKPEKAKPGKVGEVPEQGGGEAAG